MRQNWCRLSRVALLYVACTFKQVGNSKTIGYFWLLAYSTNCIKPTFAPPILRPLACCTRGQLPPSAPRSLRHWGVQEAPRFYANNFYGLKIRFAFAYFTVNKKCTFCLNLLQCAAFNPPADGSETYLPNVV